MLRPLLVACFFLLPLPGRSQARRLRDPARWQAQQDSLEHLFYQQPAYVQVSYYRNTHQRPWSRAMTLSVLQQGQWVSLQPVAGSTYLFPPLQGDSLLLGFTYAGQARLVYKVRGRDIGHGAALTFGFVKRRLLTERIRSRAEWTPTQEALQAIDLQQWHQAKGVRGLRYFRVVPRVYGDGAVFMTTTSLFRSGYPFVP
jgi:hypothetical protein